MYRGMWRLLSIESLAIRPKWDHAEVAIDIRSGVKRLSDDLVDVFLDCRNGRVCGPSIHESPSRRSILQRIPFRMTALSLSRGRRLCMRGMDGLPYKRLGR